MSVKSFIHRLNRKDIPLLPRVPKYFSFLIFLSLAIFSIFYIKKTTAVTLDSTGPDIYKIQENIAKKNNQASWLDSGLSANIVSANTLIGGTVPAVDKSNINSYKPGGAIGQMVDATSSMYYMPVSGIQYIAQATNNLLGKPAYAQGKGFIGFQPLIKLWTASRNIVYSIISFFFVILGIMIMLRVKISPQAVMNLQNTIPKIATILILVTFSYAISGLLVDLMYLLYNLFLVILFQSLGKNNLATDTLFQSYLYKDLNNPGFWDTFGLTYNLVPVTRISIFAYLLGAAIGFAAIGPLAFGVSLLLVLIINLAILIMILKFFFGLAKCYLTIILKVISGPIEIAMGAFPGSKINFNSWLTSIFANIMVFPISFGFLLLISFIINFDKSNMWAPPGLWGLGNSTINFILGFVGLMALPTLPAIVPQMITQAKPSPFGQALGKQMANVPVVGFLGKTAMGAGQFALNNALYSGRGLGKIPGINKIIMAYHNKHPVKQATSQSSDSPSPNYAKIWQDEKNKQTEKTQKQESQTY